MLKYIKELEAREAREVEDALHTGYNPGQDVMAEKDGGPRQDFQNGMLARLARLDESSAGDIVNVLCWIGVVGLVVAAINLALGRPWF
jgi:hypothetical protein